MQSLCSLKNGPKVAPVAFRRVALQKGAGEGVAKRGGGMLRTFCLHGRQGVLGHAKESRKRLILWALAG